MLRFGRLLSVIAIDFVAQDALDQVRAGDTIEISKGHYFEDIMTKVSPRTGIVIRLFSLPHTESLVFDNRSTNTGAHRSRIANGPSKPSKEEDNRRLEG